MNITSTHKPLAQFALKAPTKQSSDLEASSEATEGFVPRETFTASVASSPLSGVAPAHKPHSRNLAVLGGMGLATAGGVVGQMLGGTTGLLVGAASGLAVGAFSGKKTGDFLYGMNLPEWQPTTEQDQSVGQKAVQKALATPVEGETASERTLGRIKNVVLAGLSDLEPGELRARIKEKYQTLRLMDEEGNWTVPALEKHANSLLPDEIGKAEIETFVDSMASAASRNQYLMKFLGKTEGKTFASLRSKVKAEGAKVFKDSIALAQVLDRTTKVMAEHPEINTACREVWDEKAGSNPNFWSVQHIFENYKTKSVDLAMNIIDKERDKSEGSRSLIGFGTKMDLVLRLNIAEAGAVALQQSQFGNPELKESFKKNSKIAGILNQFGSQSGGPSGLSDDKKVWEIRPKEGKLWNDLYSTWNLEFVGNHPIWPIAVAKLLAPSVNDYERSPESYIHHRALALNTMTYYNGLSRADGSDMKLDWRDTELSQLWADSNLESGEEYREAASKA